MQSRFVSFKNRNRKFERLFEQDTSQLIKETVKGQVRCTDLTMQDAIIRPPSPFVCRQIETVFVTARGLESEHCFSAKRAQLYRWMASVSMRLYADHYLRMCSLIHQNFIQSSSLFTKECCETLSLFSLISKSTVKSCERVYYIKTIWISSSGSD